LQAFQAARSYSANSLKLFVYIILAKIKCILFSDKGKP